MSEQAPRSTVRLFLSATLDDLQESLATSLTHEELLEFIKGVELYVADVDFLKSLHEWASGELGSEELP